MTRFLLLALISFLPLDAADEARMALEAKAQADFERVRTALSPQLRDATTCIQSQAALIAVAPREMLSTVHYRKGYCRLAAAVTSHESNDFSAAAAEFQKAIDNWNFRIANGKKAPDPLPSGLRVLAAVGSLKAGMDGAGMEHARSAIFFAERAAQCSSVLMETGFCDAVLRLGRQWLGWVDLKQDNLEAAARDLSEENRAGWKEWAAGRIAFRAHNYREAATQYGAAIEKWEAASQAPVATLIEQLGPGPDFRASYVDLGSAQLLAGEHTAAIESLNRAAKLDPNYARTLFLRARARELAGQSEAALADYNLASRAAFAASQDLASGEAHLYRGILLYHRKDYSRAEDEFASALNLEVPKAFRGDASAWRFLAAVAAGHCEASRANLERAIASASPFFPREDAYKRAAACSATTAVFPPAKGQ